MPERLVALGSDTRDRFHLCCLWFAKRVGYQSAGDDDCGGGASIIGSAAIFSFSFPFATASGCT